jgi:hypothetical protein
MKPPCPRDEDWLALRANDVAPAHAAQLRAHLDACPQCAQKNQGFLQVMEILRKGDPPVDAFASRRLQVAVANQISSRPMPRVARKSARPIFALGILVFASSALAGMAIAHFGPRLGLNGAAHPDHAPTTAEFPPTQDPEKTISQPGIPQLKTVGAVEPHEYEMVEPVKSAESANLKRVAKSIKKGGALASIKKAKRVRSSVAAKSTPSPLEEARTALAQMRAGNPNGIHSWTGVADGFAAAGAIEEATEHYLNAIALGEVQTASAGLGGMIASGRVDGGTLLERLAGMEEVLARDAAAARLACEWGLRFSRKRRAVMLCRQFGERFPQDISMRSLALMSGEMAEMHLGDCGLAVGEYTRALLVSEYRRDPNNEALLGRARCHHTLGDGAQARADLELFRRLMPHQANRADVLELSEKLEKQGQVLVPPR